MKILSVSLLIATSLTLRAQVSLPNVFSDHMVLQMGREVNVWGGSKAGDEVTVSFAGQSVKAKADEKGEWKAKLQPLQASGKGQSLTVTGPENEVKVEDVLVGDVWLCSGQSNMGFKVGQSIDGDLDALSATSFSRIRLLTVGNPGSQEPAKEPNQKWVLPTKETVSAFTAVGYYFGRQIHEVTTIPIGLIDNSWGGSACEAWVRRDLLEKDVENYGPLMEKWKKTEANFDWEKVQAAYKEKLEEWKKTKQGNQPQAPQNQMTGQHRPGNLYNGRLKPVMPFTLRGAIWYQGESNAPRAMQYRELFPLMIKNWREDWAQGEFPFYWAQLADFKVEKPEPGDSDWAELREAQTLSMGRVPASGQAVITDLGEGDDIHPRQKLEVGRRLARWALAHEYGLPVEFQSPTYKAMEKKDGKVIVTFENTGAAGLETFDAVEVKGFAVAGEDKQWKWATGKLLRGQPGQPATQVELTPPAGVDPVAIRYAWADNPVCNLMAKNGLPVTPFRTDDWPGVTTGQKQ